MVYLFNLKQSIMYRYIRFFTFAIIITSFVSCKKTSSPAPLPNSLGGSPGNCTAITFAGTYSKGVPLTASNTATVQVNVETPATYTISTNTVSGVSFSKTGTFTATGLQSVVLTGSGTPTASGPQNFTVTFGSSSCTFTLTFDVTFLATLSGTSEATPNLSTATGGSVLTFNTTTKIFSVATVYSGLTATAAHIHKGVVGVSGPVIFGFSSLTSPIIFTSVALDATQEADLNGNLYYTNIHSAAFPGGEIRGQLIKQ